MGRRRQHRQEYSLDSGDLEQLSQKDIAAVIRAVDDLVGRGGRTMVGKILKGSSSKDVLELGYDKNPAYGHFRDLTLAKIGHRVDWMIEQGYLEIHYSGRLPCLSFSRKGLAWACRIRSEEWFQQCSAMVQSGGPYLMTFLKDCNRRTIFQLLDRISQAQDTSFIPLLEAWAEIDYKKVTARIRRVIRECRGDIPRQQHTFATCLIDESVSQAEHALFVAWAKDKGYYVDQTRWIANEAPGVQDKHILDHMLDSETCLVTSDRVLHNVALSTHHASFFIGEDGQVSTTEIKGIKPRGILASKEPLSPKLVPSKPKTDSDLRALLPPTSTRRQKNLRTKRRRIRNYFGGLENMAQVAATLSMATASNADTLVGIRLKISAISGGIKGLDASETYLQEPGDAPPLAAFCHLLVILIQLQLNEVPLMVYYDTATLTPPLKSSPRDKLTPLYSQLRKEFAQIDFTPTPKGPQIERLRTKLQNLSDLKSNEILRTPLTEIARTLLSN